MINYKNFTNAHEFQNIFGWRECGNGNKARKNKILLGCLRDKTFFRMCAHNERYGSFLRLTSMADFKSKLLFHLEMSSHKAHSERSDTGYIWRFRIDGLCYSFWLPELECDNDGVCMDGDTKAIRYYSHEKGKYFKMKAGKFLNRIMESCEFGKALPQQAKCWLGEEFSTSWEAFAEARQNTGSYEFHYGDSEADFEYIYSSEHRRDDFQSCMTDKGYHDMYSNSCKCHAAWLTDANGLMFARCVIWDEVHDETTGKTLRLAERQYSDGVQDKYKKMLVDELIKRDLIDGYKQIGASCHDNRAFVLNDGTSISDHRLCIDCSISYDDHVSYMDSFVYYDDGAEVAYNYEPSSGYYELDTTEGCLGENHEDDCWSDRYQTYISQDEAFYVERHDDYYYYDDVVEVDGCNELEEDCVECEGCGEWVLRDDAYQIEGSRFEDLYFCDEMCAQNWLDRNGYTWCDYEEEYYDGCTYEVHIFMGGYWTTTEMKDTTLAEKSPILEHDGEYYLCDSDEAMGAFEKQYARPVEAV